MKTLIVGLGNPILGDDGVGWQITEKLQQIGTIPSDVNIECLGLGGISLMERLIGYDRAILIDSIVTHQSPLGTVNVCRLEDLPDLGSGHSTAVHDTSLQNALKIGHSLGAKLPDDITLITIESQNVYDFSDKLTEPVARAVPEAIRIIMDLLIESKTIQPMDESSKS